MKMQESNGERPLITSLKTKFEEIYGQSTGSHLILTPGSLILLGDHTHYNDGILLSVALNKYSAIIIRKRNDQLINMLNLTEEHSIEFAINEIDDQSDYKFRLQLCLLKMLRDQELLKHGFDCILQSEVPECLGLGAIASREICFATALKKVLNLEINTHELLGYVRQCELQILGKISNIAHHYTLKFEKENKFFAFDLRTLDHKTITNNYEDINLVLIDTKEKIPLVSDTCNERIEECEVGVKGLRLYIWGIKNLRDIEQDFLMRHYHMLPRRIFNRVLYNVSERIRTEEAIKYLKKNMIKEFGDCITRSHQSISYDYDLNHHKSDFIVEKAKVFPGVIGSKMISCSPWISTFHIVNNESTLTFIKQIKKSFKEEFNCEPEAHIFKIAGATKELSAKQIEMLLSE
ncbi:MAG TPA: galactokinase family protein [Melioribacteraceae bacterium]|nr:galactokinase family protein [Melioribacteraceae bacterium]